MADLFRFRSLVEQYLKKAGYFQKDLATQANLSDAEFNRRFGGKGRVKLKAEDVKLVVLALAKWKAIETRQQAQELLMLMEVNDFSPAQWANAPLTSLLDQPLSQPEGARVLDNAPKQPLEVLLKRSRPCPVPPPAPDHFGGRLDELNGLKEEMKAGGEIGLTSMVTGLGVMGLGGIGKTTVARKLAYDLYANSDEKIFCSVLWKEIKKNPDPLTQLLEWAYLAEPAFIANYPRPEQLVHQVRALLENLIQDNCNKDSKSSRVLVVFDDVWDDGIETVRLLRQACPSRATILITSRSVKACQLLSQRQIKLNKLKPEQGVLLLAQYLQGFDRQLLFELAKVLDGHALALTIAARRVLLEEKHRQTAALQEHIEQYQREIPAGTPFDKLDFEMSEDKEDNLTKALYYSYAELNSKEQQLFRFLGVLPYNAPFDENMLAAIWDIDLSQIKGMCKRLRLLSLIDEDEIAAKEQGGSWYRQHPLVQSYAKSLLSSVS